MWDLLRAISAPFCGPIKSQGQLRCKGVEKPGLPSDRRNSQVTSEKESMWKISSIPLYNRYSCTEHDACLHRTVQQWGSVPPGSYLNSESPVLWGRYWVFCVYMNERGWVMS